MQLSNCRCCTCHSTLAAQQLLNKALHRALVHKNAMQDDTKQPALWNCLPCMKSAMQQLRIAAACCSWACALFSFALQQDRSTVQTAVFSFTYLLGLGSSANALSALSETNQLLKNDGHGR